MEELSKNRRAPVNSSIQDGGLDAHNRNKQISCSTDREDIKIAEEPTRCRTHY